MVNYNDINAITERFYFILILLYVQNINLTISHPGDTQSALYIIVHGRTGVYVIEQTRTSLQTGSSPSMNVQLANNTDLALPPTNGHNCKLMV